MNSTEIKKLRKDLGLTQEEFAQQLMVSYSTINRWEGGKNEPRKVFIKMLTALREKTPRSTSD